ncbi:YbjQ family protein [Thalassobacter stenotrophicus]|nr:heavy metal-binding domain-containing protein [Thalassobacter stenotrophicus]
MRQGHCPSCRSEAERAERDRPKGKTKQVNSQIDAILLTTETAPNLNISKRIEIVTAECAFGMNVFKDLFAGVRNVVGGRSEAVQKTMRDSRRTALYELKKEAYEVGANAVVGVDLDYVELSSSGSMVMLVASGTAVVIEG